MENPVIKLIIISGRSGSGKSTALHVLEDLGYYCIDNMPLELLLPLVTNLKKNQMADHVSVGIDARNIITDLGQFPDIVVQLTDAEVQVQTVYLDATSSILVNRFSETRRKHPLSNSKRSLKEALEYEKQLLEPISNLANLKIDTSSLTFHELRDMIRSRVAKSSFSFALLFKSFAYKNGVPVDADLVFDARCLPNPYWKPELRSLTGEDEAVRQFLDGQPDFVRMYDDILSFLESWLARFEANNRSYMTVAIGCTGGRHRSVYLCHKLHQHFLSRWDNVLLKHRELNTEIAT